MYSLECILLVVCLMPILNSAINAIQSTTEEKANPRKYAFAKINAKKAKNAERRFKRSIEGSIALHADIVNNISNIEDLVSAYSIVLGKTINSVKKYLNNLYYNYGLESVVSCLSCVSQLDSSICFRYANYYDQMLSIAKQNGYFPLSDLIDSKTKHEPKTSSNNALFAMPQIQCKYPLLDLVGNCSSSISINEHQITFDAKPYTYIDTSISYITSKNEIKSEAQKTKLMKALFRIYPLTNRNSSLNDVSAINRNFVEQLFGKKVELKGFEKVDDCGKAKYIPLIDQSIALDYLNNIEASYPKHLDPYCESNLAHSSDKNGISFDRNGNAITNATLNFKSEFGFALSQSDYTVLSINTINARKVKPQQFTIVEMDDQFKNILSIGLNRNVLNSDAFWQLGNMVLARTFSNSEKLVSMSTCIAKTAINPFYILPNHNAIAFLPSSVNFVKEAKLEAKQSDLDYHNYSNFFANKYFGIMHNVDCMKEFSINRNICPTKISQYVYNYEHLIPTTVNVMANLRDLEALKEHVIIKSRMGRKIDANIANEIIENKASLFEYYVSDASCKCYYHAKLSIALKTLAQYKDIILLTKNYTISTFDTNNNSDLMNQINKSYRLIDTKRYEDKDSKYNDLFRLKEFKNNVYAMSDELIEKELMELRLLDVEQAQFTNRRAYYAAIQKAIKSKSENLHSEISAKRKFLMERKKSDKAKKDDEVRAFNELIETFNTVSNYSLGVEKSADMKKISYVKVKTNRKDRVFARDYAFYINEPIVDFMRQRSLINTMYKVGRQQRGCSNRILAKTVCASLLPTNPLFPLVEKVNTNQPISESELNSLLVYGSEQHIISKIFTFHCLKVSNKYLPLLVDYLVEQNVLPARDQITDQFNDVYHLVKINKKMDGNELKFDIKTSIIESINVKNANTYVKHDKTREELYNAIFKNEEEKGWEQYLYISTTNKAIIEELDIIHSFCKKQLSMKIKTIDDKVECQPQQLKIRFNLKHYESELDFMFYLLSINQIDLNEVIMKITSYKKLITKEFLTNKNAKKDTKILAFKGADNIKQQEYEDYKKRCLVQYKEEKYDFSDVINAFKYYQKYEIHSQKILSNIQLVMAHIYSTKLLIEESKYRQKAFGLLNNIIPNNFVDFKLEEIEALEQYLDEKTKKELAKERTNPLLSYMSSKYDEYCNRIIASDKLHGSILFNIPRKTLDSSIQNVIISALKSEGKSNCEIIEYMQASIVEKKKVSYDNKSEQFEDIVHGCPKGTKKCSFIPRDASSIVRVIPPKPINF